MFAVIRTGGKQYRVAKDDLITVEKLAAEPGDAIELGEVLMLGDGAMVATGAPLVTGAVVSATVVEQSRAAKIIVFKKKRRHNYRRKKGHRQYQTVLRIDGISGAGSPPTVEEALATAFEGGPAVDERPPVGEARAIEGGPAIGEAPAIEEGVSDGS
jgi:large subunit ribosomal protein L21